MFDFFISLGRACHTAASMSKYGLRAFSGPFDWLITPDFTQVLRFIENDFEGFFCQENMVPYSERRKAFKDSRSGFIFSHEEKDFRFEFGDLKKKYDRRIERFISATHAKTCFLRSVTGQKELRYVVEHASDVRQIIKKNCPENEIVFLLRRGLEVPEDMPFQAYNVVHNDGSKEYYLRGHLTAARI